MMCWKGASVLSIDLEFSQDLELNLDVNITTESEHRYKN